MNSPVHNDIENKHKEKKIPVTLLAGFLGSGKTTLLKHILETKHNSNDGKSFKCGVIVNDVAELNIDKALIDQTQLLQSNEIISMQNGCVCCTLKSDLVKQIIDMASSQDFDYMIIEASGISEPSEIAKLFDECEEDHDHGAEHATTKVLSDVARLDTCVTLIDAADFFNKLHTILKGTSDESYAKLMVEQIEYSNVIVINKADLVSQSQMDKIADHVCILNPDAKIVTTKHSTVDMKDVLDTKLYNAKDFENFLSKEIKMEEDEQSCQQSRTIDSGVSQVVLRSKKLPKTRHESRFGITSFIYKARRPFHPKRLQEDFLTKYFVLQSEVGECDEEMIKLLQEEAENKELVRIKELGGLLRSKGFLWTAHAHDFMVEYGHAMNAVTMNVEKGWNVIKAKAWTGTALEKATHRRDFVDPYGDRRQEIVFIGQNMNHHVIQTTLDDCLLSDEEFDMGVDGWKAIIGDVFVGDLL